MVRGSLSFGFNTLPELSQITVFLLKKIIMRRIIRTQLHRHTHPLGRTLEWHQEKDPLALIEYLVFAILTTFVHGCKYDRRTALLHVANVKKKTLMPILYFIFDGSNTIMQEVIGSWGESMAVGTCPVGL